MHPHASPGSKPTCVVDSWPQGTTFHSMQQPQAPEDTSTLNATGHLTHVETCLMHEPYTPAVRARYACHALLHAGFSPLPKGVLGVLDADTTAVGGLQDCALEGGVDGHGGGDVFKVDKGGDGSGSSYDLDLFEAGVRCEEAV
mmetsp:Transcript_15108/g.32750  ORF Transcript_15108/g.32750 Transcript_15108/m.32750 type:complete len:143 (-) Transcript_15108:719-1147(-)